MSQLHRRDVLWLPVVSHHDPLLRRPFHCRDQNERRCQWIDFVSMMVMLHARRHFPPRYLILILWVALQ
jgi:hypothetical protein